MTLSRRTAAAVVFAAVIAYPLATLAGGAPRFPSRADCARPATAGAERVQVVYGRMDDPAAAEDVHTELDRVGLVGAEIEVDACGRWEVAYKGVESFEQAQALAEQARAIGFDARVELEE